MPKFRTFTELEEYWNKRIPSILARSKDFDRIMSEAMSQAVVDVVYGAFEPKRYQRRGDLDGLSDVRNMGITNFGVNSQGEAFIVFENLTEGADNLSGEFTTDTIVEGISSNWGNPEGPWVDQRDFVGETAKRLRENPTELVNAFKKALAERGFSTL